MSTARPARRSLIRPPDDPNDAFWLAQTYFFTSQFSRAEKLLTRPFPNAPPFEPPAAAANGHGAPESAPPPFVFGQPAANAKGKARDAPGPLGMGIALSLGLGANLEPTAPLAHGRLPVGPSAMLDAAEEDVGRLVDMSVACRYLAAQCQMRQGKWTDAMEMLGEANPFRELGECGAVVGRWWLMCL